MKHEANNTDVVEFDLGEVQTINFRCQDIFHEFQICKKKHSHGNKTTQEFKKLAKIKECTLKAHVKAIANMINAI